MADQGLVEVERVEYVEAGQLTDEVLLLYHCVEHQVSVLVPKSDEEVGKPSRITISS